MHSTPFRVRFTEYGVPLMSVPPLLERLNTALTALDITVIAGRRVNGIWELDVTRDEAYFTAKFTHTEELITDEQVLKPVLDISLRLHASTASRKLGALQCSTPKPTV